MDRTERFYRIDQLLHDRRVVPLTLFLDELGVSRATFKRDLEYMRDRLNAPIVWDRERGGYRFGAAEQGARQYELPGLWFNASEIHALLTMQQLLENLQPGLLGPHVQPLLARIQALIGEGDHALDEVQRRIRILHMAARRVPPRHFETVSSALLSRKRLEITHYSRGQDRVTSRELSPQRLVFYRDNWYLDAWCHLRKDLRSFAMDAVRSATIIDRAPRPVSERTLDRHLASGYGIFAGGRTRKARLRFSPERSRWVADEVWHPSQSGRFDDAGYWLLEFPYSDDRELLLDILRHGDQVEVLAPMALRAKVHAAHLRAARLHQDGVG
jgi:predicted DNA-binding transcriptional regulator YafY